jgi:hypothetical protein
MSLHMDSWSYGHETQSSKSLVLCCVGIAEWWSSWKQFCRGFWIWSHRRRPGIDHAVEQHWPHTELEHIRWIGKRTCGKEQEYESVSLCSQNAYQVYLWLCQWLIWLQLAHEVMERDPWQRRDLSYVENDESKLLHTTGRKVVELQPTAYVSGAR